MRAITVTNGLFCYTVDCQTTKLYWKKFYNHMHLSTKPVTVVKVVIAFLRFAVSVVFYILVNLEFSVH